MGTLANLVLLQEALPPTERVRAAYQAFQKTLDTFTLVQYGLAVLAVVVIVGLLARIYMAWDRKAHGLSQEYLRKRKKLE